MWTRRDFLYTTGALASATALGELGCATSSSPAPTVVARTERSVERTLRGLPTMDGAGTQLTRVIGSGRLPRLDPFLLLDRIVEHRPGAVIPGFPSHPHRGFETVSILLEGHVAHRDSKGNAGNIVGGGAQWMTAGRGIVHSEMPGQDLGHLSAFQLWINLPAREKLCVPVYQDLAPERVVEGTPGSGAGRVRVIAGQVDGLVGPVRERPTAPLLTVVTLEDDRPLWLDMPPEHAAFVFVHAGAVELGPEARSTTVNAEHLAVLGPGHRVRLRARDQRSVALVAAGRPLHEPIAARGPFVMNTEAELQQAFADYQAGVLDKG